MLALGGRYHGVHVGRHFILWHLLRWGFSGPLWHPFLLLGVVLAIVAAILATRGGGPGSGSGSGRGMRRDAGGRLQVDRDLEERSRR